MKENSHFSLIHVLCDLARYTTHVLILFLFLFQLLCKMSKEVADEYLSSLADLTVNSKPLINMLTMLADENVDHAPAIVQVIESHIQKVK